MVPHFTVLIHFLRKILLLDFNDQKGNFIRMRKRKKIKVSYFHISIIYLSRPTLRISNSYNPFGMLLRSLMPNFNLEVINTTKFLVINNNSSLEFSCPY